MTDLDRHEPRDQALPGPAESPTLGEIVAEIASDAATGTAPAAPPPAARAAAADQWVLLSQSGSSFAVPIRDVQEVGSVPVYTWVPGAPLWVLGVTNFRGEIISVVDLGEFLALEPSTALAPRRMVVAKSHQRSLVSGFVVDAVGGEVRIGAEQVRPPTAPVDERIQPYLQGVFRAKGEIHALLDLERLMLSDAFRVLRSTHRAAHVG
jgi:chemotaxis signal transduction protein